MSAYDPFAPGPFDVRMRTVELPDPARGRVLRCDVWEPAGLDGPVVVYSSHAGGDRRVAGFLTRHLAGHGYRVAAVDHSETSVPELQPQDGETAAERAARVAAVVGSRVPDVRLVLDALAPATAGLVGHSLGGWTVLAAADDDPRVGAVVAHAPGGSRHPVPGVVDVPLRFARAVPTLVLAAENDVPVPLDDVLDVFERIPGPRRLAVLRGADHQHFVDDVALREGASTPPEQAHAFVRGLTVAHLDAYLRDLPAAHEVLDRHAVAEPAGTE
jgi:dienelactone hydrolase